MLESFEGCFILLKSREGGCFPGCLGGIPVHPVTFRVVHPSCNSMGHTSTATQTLCSGAGVPGKSRPALAGAG